MIQFKTGDIFREQTEAIVNTVNCVGVMGRGIALQFKKQYPDNFKAYEKACRLNEVVPGKMFIVQVSSLTNPKYIINFPTKRHWRASSRIEDIELGLQALIEDIDNLKIRSIAIPPLGCGLGGLEWSSVKPKIEDALKRTEADVVVFEPNGTPDTSVMVKNFTAPNMTPGRAALIGLMHRYQQGLLDPVLTLLEVHKLLYFMQEAGQPLKLNYEKAIYGPYATNLGHVLNHVEGHYIIGYGDGGDLPLKQLELVPGAVADAEQVLRNDDDTIKRFEKVAQLVSGFETPFGLELLASVHWVAKHEDAKASVEAVKRLHEWNDRKKQFSTLQVEKALAVLEKLGWICEA